MGTSRMKVFVFALLCAAAAGALTDESEFSMESNIMDIPFNKILGIKKAVDESYLESPDSVNPDVKLLGDSDAMAAMESHASADARDEGMLLEADKLLQQMVTLRKERMRSASLGESMEETEDHEFPKILARKPREVADTVRNVVTYLGNMIDDGQLLTEDQIHQARKWYLQTTAIVLGRYAYEAQQAKLDKNGVAGFDALQSRAEDAKQSMDKIDAAEHLRKMGAENWMDHSGTNILELLKKTGRLSLFLSEIEAVERNNQKGFVGETSDVKKLQAREAEITKAVNNLLARVEAGDPITGEATEEETPASASDSAREKKLMGKLMVAADKEDKARIVEAAGEVAEKQITSVMNIAQKDMEKDEQKLDEQNEKAEEERKEEIEDEREEAAGIHVVHNAVPMVMTRDDLVAPMSTLHQHVTDTVNQHLDRILKLFKERKESHQKMSIGDYKNVNSVLRGLAAHLMQKYADQSEERPYALKVPLAQALTMPLSAAAWMRKPADIKADHLRNAKYVKEHHAHPLNEALMLPLAEAKKLLKQDDTAQKDTANGSEKGGKNEKGADNGFGSPFGPAAPQDDEKGADNGFGSPFGPATPEDEASTPADTAKEEQPQEHAPAAPPATVDSPAAVAPAPASPAAGRDPVTQFVWSTLGKGGVNRINEAASLADLLKGGVHLPTSGFVRFVTPNAE